MQHDATAPDVHWFGVRLSANDLGRHEVRRPYATCGWNVDLYLSLNTQRSDQIWVSDVNESTMCFTFTELHRAVGGWWLNETDYESILVNYADNERNMQKKYTDFPFNHKRKHSHHKEKRREKEKKEK